MSDQMEVSTVTPLTLLDKALEKGVTAEELSQWMDLEKRWRADQALQAFNVAFNEAQSEMPIIVKDAENKQKGSHYARLEAVSKVVTPISTRHGFATSFTEATCEIPECRKIIATVRHKSGHSEQFCVNMPMDGKGAKGGDVMNAPQAFCSSLSYAQRRLLCLAWNLTVADSDQDGEVDETVLTEDELTEIRVRLHQHFDAGIGKHPDLETMEARFVKWAAAKQGTPDVTKLEGIYRSTFSAAVIMLDRRMREHERGATS